MATQVDDNNKFDKINKMQMFRTVKDINHGNISSEGKQKISK